jgi:hypothetical protein
VRERQREGERKREHITWFIDSAAAFGMRALADKVYFRLKSFSNLLLLYSI